MIVRHYAQGKWYRIPCPEGSRVERRADPADPDGGFAPDRLLVPFEGEVVPIPADPPELLPLLAESGRFGLALDGEPQPEARLAGAACPRCGEDDITWLVFEDGSEWVHCDRCGADFGLTGIDVERPVSKRRSNS